MNGRVSKMKNTRGLLASELAATQDLQDSFRVVKERMEIAATIRRVSVSSALSGSELR